MEVMNRKDEQLFVKLVRLAGGDTGIVMRALSSVPRRHGDSAVDLREVVTEIEHQRQRVAAAANV